MYIGKIETGKSYKRIFILFAIITLALIGFVCYASFSKATISITPKKEEVSINFQINASSTPDLNLLKVNNIKGRILTETLEEKQKITDIALKEVDDYAKGKVIIYNKRDQSQGLLPRTQLKPDNSDIIFRTDQSVNVPAHGQIEVGVTADTKGTQGNIQPTHFTIVKIWQHWQNLIYAESYEPMTGGTKMAKVATQEEINKAKEKVTNDLYQKGAAHLKEKLSQGESLKDEMILKEEVASWVSVEPDTQTDEFEMYVKLKLYAIIFDETTLLDLAKARLEEQIPQNKELINFIEQSFKYNVKSVDLTNKKAEISVSLSANVAYRLSSNVFDKENFIGKSVEEAKEYLAKFEEIENIKISLSPFWVKSIPSLKDHIEINVIK